MHSNPPIGEKVKTKEYMEAVRTLQLRTKVALSVVSVFSVLLSGVMIDCSCGKGQEKVKIKIKKAAQK